MGFRLLFLSWWTPEFLIRKELENISETTIDALRALISKHAIEEAEAINKKRQAQLSIQEQRAAMAQAHVNLVEALVATVGYEEAVKLGREALFLVGQNVGQKVRGKLGVSNKPKDLTKAAKILYRVLGIKFHLEWLDNSNANAIIDRCALADYYSDLTCKILSAIDEGVIKGLQTSATMRFKEYMTSGCENCMACIHIDERETLR